MLTMAFVGILFSRINVNLDFDWRVAAGPRPESLCARAHENAEGNSWFSADWKSVDLPHDFQFEQPWDRRANALRGYKACESAVYRKTFVADKAWEGQRVALDFGGILVMSEIYVNGRKVAENDFGYLGFELDVSKDLIYGATNSIAVKACAGPMIGSRWYTGAGLYRGVKLVVRNPISIARHGVKITTGEVSGKKANVDVTVELEGVARSMVDRTIAAVLFDPQGREVGSCKCAVPKDTRRKVAEIKLPSIEIKNPLLWDIDSPHLYTAKIYVREGDKVLDILSYRFGIRTVEFGKEFGLRINGRKVFLKGISNHHDLGSLGAAAYPSEIRRRIKLLKEFGFNAVRCSHNPYSKEFYDLADEMGLLVVDELCDKWTGLEPGRSVASNFFDLTTEWVKRGRNHPSIILWSLGNELQHDEKFSGFQSNDEGVTTYKILSTVVDRWDGTRKKTVAMYPAREGGYTWRDGKKFFEDFTLPRLSLTTDIASFNYNYEHYEEFFRRYPNIILFQSEAAVRDLLRPYWDMDRNRTVGLSYWGAIEYWGESFGWPAKGWVNSFFAHDLHPYPTAYLLKTEFRKDVPQVRIAIHEGGEERVWNDVLVGNVKLTENWNRKAGDKVRVVVFTNGEKVELFLNGRSLGVRNNDSKESAKRNFLEWNGIAWEEGKLEAVSYVGGVESARHSIETVGEASSIRIEKERGEWVADGYDLAYFKIRFVDSKGREVPVNNTPVKVQVEGSAKLVALDEGDHRTDKLFNVNEKAPHDGRLLAIVRAGKTPGKVTIRCEAKGFKTTEFNVKLLDVNERNKSR